jgi:hypothetical protein
LPGDLEDAENPRHKNRPVTMFGLASEIREYHIVIKGHVCVKTPLVDHVCD